ncbi:MAG: hypothetical protein ACNA8W_26735, partial [Bradymonadaceae bacterium]
MLVHGRIVPLVPGDRIRIGGTKMEVRADGAPRAVLDHVTLAVDPFKLERVGRLRRMEDDGEVVEALLELEQVLGGHDGGTRHLVEV